MVRPSRHLAMYVDKRGNPLPPMWIASRDGRGVGYEAWQRLASAIFYLSWSRIPYVTIDRAAAEDFYFETFVVPESAEIDSATHVRWSKFGTTVWSDIKVYPALEVALEETKSNCLALCRHNPLFMTRHLANCSSALTES